MLKDYQLDRFMAFTNPALDPRGAGYNAEQARIAVGNGGLFGQGLFDGSQTRSGFVPEQHTDFIFTVAGEELGLVGAGVLIALLARACIWRALRIAAHADDMFGRVAAAGIACWFGFQAFQNIGMCLGIMPVTGVPAPVRVVRRLVDVRRACWRSACCRTSTCAPTASLPTRFVPVPGARLALGRAQCRATSNRSPGWQPPGVAPRPRAWSRIAEACLGS